ncbi:hypothetical protein [uncultured Parabacteroides sp.]|uniref:hypothetical protein n=1 Tax=uncultured Parabacteroides sp. TaxID=512312 RepID=UPI00262D8C35|nr:hypothetical protein [uncultured Parabacteroides sp.]
MIDESFTIEINSNIDCVMGKDKVTKRKFKAPEEWQAIWEKRFSYLPKKKETS